MHKLLKLDNIQIKITIIWQDNSKETNLINPKVYFENVMAYEKYFVNVKNDNEVNIQSFCLIKDIKAIALFNN